MANTALLTRPQKHSPSSQGYTQRKGGHYFYQQRPSLIVEVPMPHLVDVSVTLLSDDLDTEQLDDSTRRLRSELLDLDVDRVTTVSGEGAPEGTRGFDAELVGQLVVGIGPGLVALRQLLDTLRGWRSNQRHLEISVQIGEDRLELTDASPETEKQLVNAFVMRHASA
jgi:hypothetical protein